MLQPNGSNNSKYMSKIRRRETKKKMPGNVKDVLDEIASFTDRYCQY